VELLRERGLFFAEIVYALDKPVSRVTHALDLLMGVGNKGCIYSLIEDKVCPGIPKVAGNLPIDEETRYKFMQRDMRTFYLECVRYGVIPEVKMKIGHKRTEVGQKAAKSGIKNVGYKTIDHAIADVSGREVLFDPSGSIAIDGRNAKPEQLHNLLADSYHRRLQQ
jgi:hypothetical protein